MNSHDPIVQLPFADRTEAGRLLGESLSSRRIGPDPIVLALPRGGVPIGAEVAAALNAPMDVLVVRKLGVPWQPEAAMGAITDGASILDRRLIRVLRIPEEEMERIVAHEAAEVRRCEKLYRGDWPKPALHDRAVVLVDDGLATGFTMTAAARAVRGASPRKLIVAVPVGSTEACSQLAEEADHCICLATPEPFVAVGEWYIDFEQLTDEVVQQTLMRSRARDT